MANDTMKLFDDYWPHPHQYRVHTCGKRFVYVMAGRRGGKTKCGAREFLRRIFKKYRKIAHLPYKAKYEIAGGAPRIKPRLHYWAVAPDYSLSKVQQRELFDVLPPEQIAKWKASDKELWLKGDILIEFKSAQNPDSLVAVGLNGMWVDEVARLRPTAWSGNLRPCLSDTGGWAIFTTTPLGKNWSYEEIYRLGNPKDALYEPEYANITWRTVDNIRVPLLADEVEKAKKTMPLKYFMREYEASLEIFAGQVYDNWEPYVHKVGENNKHGIVRPPRRFDRLICGVDWGYANPGCLILFGVKDTKLRDIGGNRIPKFWALREIYKKRLPVVSPDPDADSWVKEAKNLNAYCMRKYGKAVEAFYCDPSEPAYIDYFLEADLPAQPANNAVGPGIQTVSTLMEPYSATGTPWLFYVEDSNDDYYGCENLIEQKGSYRFKEDKEEPVKENDHAVDAERYALHTYVEEYGIEIRVIDIPRKQAA